MFCLFTLQIQFGMAFTHSAQLLWTDCGYPRWSVCFTLPNAIFFYMLFNDFYKKSYTKKGKAAEAAKKIKIANAKGQVNNLLDINSNKCDQRSNKQKKSNKILMYLPFASL